MSENLARRLQDKVAGYVVCMAAGLLLSLTIIAIGVELLAYRLVQPWDAELIELSGLAVGADASAAPSLRGFDGR